MKIEFEKRRLLVAVNGGIYVYGYDHSKWRGRTSTNTQNE